MLARLGHRGPDDMGERRVGRSWIGHARLSIVDLEGGGQPLVDRDGRRFVICNGEIYNHRALRERLGHDRFLTDSDCEAALHAVAAWGPSAVAELKGMFAVCVADADGGVVMARDLLGIKPLYWARRGERTLFASELRAFEPEWRRDVRTFPPGHVWTPEDGLRPFGTIAEEADLFTTRSEAVEAVRAALITGVRRRLMADVPVGVFLSGGLDSSLVAAIATREVAGSGERLRSFAVGLAGSPDLAAARTVADHLGLEHHERVYDATEAAAVLERAVAVTESYEPSLVRSAVPNYLLAELAALHVKVVLTGEGADELFAGYDHYRDIADAEELNAELVRNVAGLHDLNLQRCDRVTMAHGLEARVPFLDLDLIAVAQRVPPPWKLPGPTGQEKRLLREAFEGWLPHETLWRRKAQFGDGSGASTVLPEYAASLVGPDWESERVDGLPAPRSREELAYQRIFADHLAGIRADQVLGRFATA
ncbi:MAG: asparagine synthase (glutamine-hydrolyzing) [Nitriliruptorales bacterium]|nr:asparagine synthase (glutamine-hydrolyzing) [Nitriliruptorales bacterium]